ncbi:UrcA family protein [Sphingopyxis macrogoltabida]|uniref:UrcA family protein n=1 Tax=Sphingopyxis macrogoltabida TaxID=33050 RepID=A0AAC9AW20_SPHMC|nr:UrcA family protein [Sphingopyxis macrogoltabida]ALJ14688.1 hypothetical protein LH19_17595 [Sphingopyxis macrogoltabida]AMU90947.1 hypothetical protein ATM17_18165 [Sphingopyxis macrogoltabida]
MQSTVRFLLPLTVLLAGAPAAVQARGGIEPVRVTISHRDLDLTDPADVAVLERRIRGSVKMACPTLARTLTEIAHARKCERVVTEQAATQKQVAIAEAEANRVRYASGGGNKAVAVQ